MDFSAMPLTLALIAINVIISAVGFSNSNFIDKTIGWPYYEKKDNQYYRWVTSGFIHADWMHLIFNMFTLFFFGSNIENIFIKGNLGGEIAYLSLYLFGLICSSIPGYVKHRDDYNYRSLGASGAVSAVLFASIVFTPWAQLGLYGVIKLSGVLFAILYVVYCVYMSKRNLDNIGHDAHLWGSVFGLIFTIVLIAALHADLFPVIAAELRNWSIIGRRTPGLVLEYLKIPQ